MKQITLFLTFLVLTSPLFSQQQNIFEGPAESGYYGALVMKLTPIQNQAAFMVGGYGGWLINHRFLLGLGGYKSVTHVPAGYFAQVAYATDPYKLYIDFDYGGLMLEYTFAPTKDIHFTVQTLIGAGQVGYSYQGFSRPLYSGANVYAPSVDQMVFVAEPALNVELNMIDWFRISAGVSLRHVDGLSGDVIGLYNRDVSDYSGNLGLKFGVF